MTQPECPDSPTPAVTGYALGRVHQRIVEAVCDLNLTCQDEECASCSRGKALPTREIHMPFARTKPGVNS
jgi:hypothetical protein